MMKRPVLYCNDLRDLLSGVASCNAQEYPSFSHKSKMAEEETEDVHDDVLNLVSITLMLREKCFNLLFHCIKMLVV